MAIELSKPKLPKEKRYENFPIKAEGEEAEDEIYYLSSDLKRKAVQKGWSEELLENVAIKEFEEFDPETEKIIPSQLLGKARKSFIDLVKSSGKLKKEIDDLSAILEKIKSQDKNISQIYLFALKKGRSLWYGQADNIQDIEKILAQKKEEQAEIREKIIEFKAKVKEFRKEFLQNKRISPELSRQARDYWFDILTFVDAKRKFRVWEKSQQEQAKLKDDIRFNQELYFIRASAEDIAALSTEEREKRFGAKAALLAGANNVNEIIKSDFFAGAREKIKEEYKNFIDAQTKIKWDEKALAELEEVVLGVLSQPSIFLREKKEEAEKTLVDLDDFWQKQFADPRNWELDNYIKKKLIKDLVTQYHVKKQRYLLFGELKDEYEENKRKIRVKNAPILRVLLYGPPGTGKTESFRKIAEETDRQVRVISLHEGSNFETLIGMQKIPLPKEVNLKEAEKFWQELFSANLSTNQIKEKLSPQLLAEFNGETDEEKIEDFKRWYQYKLNLAKELAALETVAPDDPKVEKIKQKVMGEWIDQALVEGLKQGDLIILDEIDKAGNALEGLQDILTRMPGEEYEPAGRGKPFRIHPRARVVATSNWGDMRSELTSGQSGGDLAAAIASRLVEMKRVDYAKPETELVLFNVMTNDPKGNSLLYDIEAKAAEKLIKKVLPRLRKIYLGEDSQIEWRVPISIRTLENIARRMINPDDYTRWRDPKKGLVTFWEAAIVELTKGFWYEDIEEAKRIILKEMHLAGVFDELPERPEAPRYLQIAQMANLEPEKVVVITGKEIKEE